MKKIISQKFRAELLLWAACLLSALCMVLPYWNAAFFWLSWVGLIPLLFALTKASLIKAYFFGLLFGLIFFAGCGYWILFLLQNLHADNTFENYFLAILYWGYCAQIPAFTAVVFAWAFKKLPHLAWLIPCIYWSILCGNLPAIFPTNFAITQSRWLLALQPVQITGELGLHAIIVLVNSLLLEVLLSPRARAAVSLAAGWVVVCIWFGVAHWLLAQPTPALSQVKIGIVQPDYPASKRIPDPDEGYSRAYSPELEMSLGLIKKHAELIIWPELRYTGYYTQDDVKTAIDRLAKRHEVQLLIQDLRPLSDQLTANVSTAVSARGIEATYSKQAHIPFGEKIPLVDWPLVGPRLHNFFSDIYTPLGYEKPSGRFSIANIVYQPLICYEISLGIYVNDYLSGLSERPAFLIAQSNNSWFGKSIQPQLHTASGVLRAVEQQLPLVHVMNNGPSTITSARGQIIFATEPHTRGAYVVDLPYHNDNTKSFYSQFPFAFLWALHLVAVILPFFFLKQAND